MMNKLLEKGKALYRGDEAEYEELKIKYFKREEKDLAWYVGAGFDLSILEKKVHNKIKNVFLDNTPLLMSDFYPNCYHNIMEAYKILSKECFTSEDFDKYFKEYYRRKQGPFCCSR